jgi:Helix-turn-helix.
MDVNERIRLLMEEREWTPYRLARESGLSDATIGNLFRRNTTPSIATLEAICSGLNMTLAQFFAEGNLVELTPEAKELFDIWEKLSPKEKTALNGLLNAMIQG